MATEREGCAEVASQLGIFDAADAPLVEFVAAQQVLMDDQSHLGILG
jgi:hypothetical protein